jgi:hypothetical protein
MSQVGSSPAMRLMKKFQQPLFRLTAHLVGVRSVSLALPKYSNYSVYVALGKQRGSAEDERCVSSEVQYFCVPAYFSQHNRQSDLIRDVLDESL